jgi:hypothetical protein
MTPPCCRCGRSALLRALGVEACDPGRCVVPLNGAVHGFSKGYADWVPRAALWRRVVSRRPRWAAGA